MKSFRFRWVVLVSMVIAVGPAFAADLVLTTGGRVSVELLYAEAAFSNTMSITSPSVAVAITGCKLEPASGLGGVLLLSEKLSQRGCRVDLDADPTTPGIQPFAAGTTISFGFCSQTNADANCEYVWSSDAGSNSDGKDHLWTTDLYPADYPGQAVQLAWEDYPDLGDGDFNDLMAVLRVNMDADGDGLWDDWERFGVDTNGDGLIDLNLPSLGARWDHKDIFVEIDSMDCAVSGGDCAAGDTHTHRPTAAAVNAVIQAFAAAPVGNPDGVDGITLHVDVDQDMPHQDVLNIPGLCFSSATGAGNFDDVKADPTYFGTNNPRRFAYHYALFTHRQWFGDAHSGCSELPGNDFQISMGGWNYACNGGTRASLFCRTTTDCPGGTCQAAGDTDGDGVNDEDVGTSQQVAGTFMHELGHNLGLRHGGSDNVHYKPNFLSIMNYSFQATGIPPTDPDGTGPLVAKVDYSPQQLPQLDETNLGEAAGIGDGTDQTVYACPDFSTASATGNAGIDWNCDGDTTDTAVSNDANWDRVCTRAGFNGVFDSTVSNDDLISGQDMWDGPDRTCDSVIVVDDVIVRNRGSVQVALLDGFDDWEAIKYDIQTTESFDDGFHISVDPAVELDFQRYAEQLSPDLAVAKSAAPDVVLAGSDVAYTIQVSNRSAAVAREVTVADVLGPVTTFVSCTASGTGVCGGADNDRNVMFPVIAGGSTETIQIVANVNCPLLDGTVITNSASAGLVGLERDTTNNSGAVAIRVSNPPPVVTCPASVTVECQSGEQAEVVLPPATALDICHAAVPVTNNRTLGGPDASGSYPTGSTTVTFTATDSAGNTGRCTTVVTVVDTTPPVVTVDTAPNYLWPPNHKMYGIHNAVTVLEACDPSPRLILQSVVSSELDDAPGGGDGNTVNDIQGASTGTVDFDILMRAERQGTGPGRTYTIRYQATDASGNVGAGTDTVDVPHDQDGIEEPIALETIGAAATLVSWEPVYHAQHFDIIRGSVDKIRVDGSNFDLGDVVCLATNVTANDIAGSEDTAIPEPGKVFFYLVQFRDGTKESSYGEPSAHKARVLGAGSQDCH